MTCNLVVVLFVSKMCIEELFQMKPILCLLHVPIKVIRVPGQCECSVPTACNSFSFLCMLQDVIILVFYFVGTTLLY